MSVKFLGCPAYLTGAIIAGKNSLAPILIFPCSAATSRSFILLFALRKIAAIRRAIGMIEMPVCWVKLFTTSLANMGCFRSISTGINRLTVFRASHFPELNPARKRLATNNTSPLMTIRAVIASWIVDCKQPTTALAVSLKRKLLIEHIQIIPQFSHIQRWVDMTGGEPVLLD